MSNMPYEQDFDAAEVTIEALKKRVRMLESASESSAPLLEAFRESRKNELLQQQEIKALATFPEENPDPVWRLSLTCEVMYMNPAAKELATAIHDVSEWKLACCQAIEIKDSYKVELKVKNQWFDLLFSFNHQGYVNVYGRDITDRVKATLALRQSYAEIERKVAERTHDLETVNERLAEEIQVRQQTEIKLREQSYQDELTKLGNRRRMSERITHAIDLGERYKGQFALLFLDLDHFKLINDNLGHLAGDSLLKEVAYRLQRSVRMSDTVVRMGGDEFAILLENIKAEDEVLQVANTIIRNFAAPFNMGDDYQHVHCSLGIAMFPEHGNTVTELFKCADIALYQAKEVRNTYKLYNPIVNSKLNYLNQLNSDLFDVLEQKQLYLQYQPQVRLTDGKIIGMEALVRWLHPKYGIISPLEFIPLAEANGMMVEIGDWIMHEACRTLKTWRNQGFDKLCMAVNLSPIQFTKNNLFEKVSQCMFDYNISPDELELEITESLTIADPERTKATCKRFADMGVAIAIDDFGTGYSSLSRLRDMPIKTLKIDRSFISDMCDDHDDAVFVEMIIKLSKMLNVNIVAEGVEYIEHVDFLNNLGCDIGQGYYFSRPVSAAEFAKLLESE